LEGSLAAGDGEEITNKFLTLECKSADPSDVPDSRGLQAFLRARKQRISTVPQPLVNHVSQGVVNHAGECRARYLRLTSLFKPIGARLG
jgi:hypothetical protein